MSQGQLPPEEATEQPSHQQQEQALGEDDPHHRSQAFLNRLRNQVSFYFSLQNLARDKYLRNMLTAEHPEMPSPRPAQFMCPVGVITNFPKVRDICAQHQAVGGREGQLPEPPALLLAKALEGSDVVTISSDGNWIGPVVQQLPPPTMGGAPGAMGGPPAPHHFQQSHHFQQQASHLNFQQGSYPQPQPMMVPPGAAAMQYQPPGMPPPYPPSAPSAHGVQYPNNAPMNAAPIISLGGSESPSSASLESMPSQQQQAAQHPQQGANNANDNIIIAVMDLPPGAINPIEILSAFTTEAIRPKSAFFDHLNTNLWFVSFASEADAKAAIVASAERTISGMPVHAKLNSELPSSSTASLSSMSAPGQMAQQQQQQQSQQPVPLMGGVGYPLLPQGGPSPPPRGMGTPPPPMGTAQSNASYPPQYAMPQPQIQPLPQLTGMPPAGQPYPPHQPYYNPQQQMQQVYPGGYMHQQQQQGGPPQPQQQMMQPYPPPPQMGNRFGVVPPPPPPPRSGYPGGPPPPYPYQGMHQQYVDGYGGQHYQHYGHPHPPPRQYIDRRQGGPGGPGGPGLLGGAFHDHQGHSRTGKKKKKNQQQQQQQHRRESYGSSSNDNNNGFRRNNEYSNYGQQHHLRHDDSTSPIPGHHGGGQKSSWKYKRGENDPQYQQFRRSHGNASPSFHRSFNRNHQNNDQTSGSDATASAASSSNRQVKKSDDRDIFSSSDFPGLGGLGGDDKSDKSNSKSSNSGDGSSKQQLVGYASALLKKKEAEDKKNEVNVAAPTTAVATENQEVDSITRQTEEMEREILSEFHDLSLIGDGTTAIEAALSSSPSPDKANNPQGPQHNNNTSTDDKTEGTASSSTMDASARSNPKTNNLPILPAGPFPENESGGGGGNVAQSAYSSQVLPKQQQPQPPAIDVTNSQDFPSRETTSMVVDGAIVSSTQEQTTPTVVPNDVEKPKPPGVWGSKRFADVI